MKISLPNCLKQVLYPNSSHNQFNLILYPKIVVYNN